MRKATLLKVTSAVRWVGAAMLAGMMCGMDWQEDGCRKAFLIAFAAIASIGVFGAFVNGIAWPTDVAWELQSYRGGKIKFYDILSWLIFLPGDILMVPLRILSYCVSGDICDLEE